MERKKGKVVLGVVIGVALVAVVAVVVVKIVRSAAQEDVNTMIEAEVTTEVPAESYGYVEVEKVATLARKFNQVIIDQANWEVLPVDEEAMLVHEGSYWYALDENLALVVVPVEFSGNAEEDVALVTLIYTDNDPAKSEKVLEYYRYLVQANDESLTMDEIAELMAEAEKLRERGEMANHGKGIFTAINESDDHIEYQVVRNYPESGE